MKLAAFRRKDEPDGTRRTGLVVGDGPSWWLHPFPEGTDLVELLAADATAREAAADAAAQGDGLQPEDVVLLPPVYPVAMRDFLTFEAHVDGMERGHGNPGPPAVMQVTGRTAGTRACGHGHRGRGRGVTGTTACV